MNDTSPALRVRGLTKRFGEVTANDVVSLDAWSGEVHCLLGENGAGKSTLIAMLAGLQQPDDGTIEIAGGVHAITSPAAAIECGIGVVYQHSALIPSMTVLENLMLSRGGFWLDRERVTEHLNDLSATLGTRIDPNDRVGALSLGQQQQLEIAKVMWAQPRVLVLDEPTSMLTGEETRRLIAKVRELVSGGVAVILVTHKLDEALALGDRVTVLREGRVVRCFDRSDLGVENGRARASILDAMFGGALAADAAGSDTVVGRSHGVDGASREVLRLEDVSTSGDGGGAPIADITLSVRAGEVFGVAGIDGHGQQHLAEVIAGQRLPMSGRVMLDGEDITGASVRERQRLGVRYVTDDRLHEGIVGSLSVALNLLLKRIGERPFWRFGREHREAVGAHATELIER
mgnify:FL=1